MKKRIFITALFAAVISFMFSAAVSADYSDEYKKSLSELYDCFDKQLSDFEKTEETEIKLNLGGVKVSNRGYSTENAVEFTDAKKIISVLLGEHPRLFCSINELSRMAETKTSPLLTGIKLKRIPMNSSYENAYNDITAQADETLNEIIDANMSDLDKAFAVYMYMAKNYNSVSTKDTADKSPDTLYGAVMLKSAACGGFANAYKFFMDKLGLECEVVSSESAGHLWNCLKLNGKWYNVDVSYGNFDGRLCAECFLVSDEMRKTQLVTSDTRKYDWQSIHDYVVCGDNTYEKGYIFNSLKNDALRTLVYSDGSYSFEMDGESFSAPSLYVMDNMISLPRSNITGKLAGVEDMSSAYSVVYGNKRSFTAYIVSYNSDGEITDINRRDITFSSSDRKIDLSASGNAYSIKIFFWTDSMTPVANVIEIK